MMLVLGINTNSFDGALHKALGERISAFSWSYPLMEPVRIAWKRTERAIAPLGSV